jgi:hypothetical protein
MTRNRDVANVLTAATTLSTDIETAAAITTHASAADPHTSYALKSGTTFTGQVGVGLAPVGANRVTIGGTSFTLDLHRYASSGGVPGIELKKSLSDTVGSHIALTSSSSIGRITAMGSDGTNFITSSQILFESDGTVLTNIIPGRIIFSTNNSAGTAVERMRIDSNGLSTFSGALTVSGNLTATAGTTSLGATNMSGLLTGMPNSNGGTLYASNDSANISIRSSGANPASMSFHRPGIFAVNMGLDTDNQFKIGGWSAGGTDNFVLQFGVGLFVIGAKANTAQSTADGRYRNIFTSTSGASGGNDGDVWLTYTA